MSEKHEMKFRVRYDLTSNSNYTVRFETPNLEYQGVNTLPQKIRILADKITAGLETKWKEEVEEMVNKNNNSSWDHTKNRSLEVILDVDNIELIRTKDYCLPVHLPQCLHELCYRLALGLESMKYDLTDDERDVVENGGILQKGEMTLMSKKLGDEIEKQNNEEND